MKRLVCILLLLGLVPCPAMAFPWSAPKDDPTPAAAEPEEPLIHYNMVILQGLNKVTGHVSKFEVPLGTSVRFGNLEIVARRCWKSNPEDQPENAALLDISESKPGEPPQEIFLGWMFSSSPGLSGLEHPVYDITMISCEVRPDPEKPAEKPPEKKK